ncbi:hypothetical protein Slin14017_G084170 [Septoria linicola]|nr:hypothetical protein Slin14017_G084170 [Septoria linicola]
MFPLTLLSLLTTTSLAYPNRRQSSDYGYQFSNALSTGPASSTSFIRSANTTLILPATNTPQTGNLALWPGMGTSGGNLIQGLAISVADGSAGCKKEESVGKWCVVASTLEETQQMGEYVVAEEGARVGFYYEYNDSTKEYDQTVSVNGKVVSKISTSSGVAQGWGTAVECQSAACGTVPAHKYVDTTLTMDVADPDYDQTKGTTGATGEMVTADGGKTWTIAEIAIESHTYE